jgi:ferredoxin
VWDELPIEVQEQIIDKQLRMFVIDAYEVARAAGMGKRINTIMQTCFFAISGVLPREEAIGPHQARHREDLRQTRRGCGAAELSRRSTRRSPISSRWLCQRPRPPRVVCRPLVPDAAPDFVKRVTAVMLANQGDRLPVSAFPIDGTWPTGTSKWEKRNIASEIPVWNQELCIQCNKCALVCPHAAIRVKVYPHDALADAPHTFKHLAFKSVAGTDPIAGDGRNGAAAYTVQVAPEDCTGCELCVMMCPAKDKKHPDTRALEMAPQALLRDAERENYSFFLDLPEVDRARIKPDVKSTQVPRAALRVFGRVRRLRRDALPQADDAALRRPRRGRQRHRLLVDLRRQPADHAVHHKPRRPRPGVGEFAVRGQRRIRARPATLDRSARGARGRVADRACRAVAVRPGGRHPQGRSAHRGRHRRAARAGRGAGAGSIPRPQACSTTS